MNRLPAFVYDPEAVSSRLLVRRFQEAGIKGWVASTIGHTLFTSHALFSLIWSPKGALVHMHAHRANNKAV